MYSIHPNEENIGRGDCYASGWIAMRRDSLQSLTHHIQVYVTSPIVFLNGVRSKKNFIYADWIALDFDEGPSLDEITSTFQDHIHLIGPTQSHQKPKGNKPPCDRFRVWLKTRHTITNHLDYEATIKLYVSRYDADPACVDAARMFWPCNTITSSSRTGYTVDVVPAEIKVYAPVDSSYNGKIPYWVRDWLNGDIPADASRNRYLFKSSAWLARNGWSELNILDLVMGAGIRSALGKEELTDSEVIKAVKYGYERGRCEK